MKKIIYLLFIPFILLSCSDDAEEKTYSPSDFIGEWSFEKAVNDKQQVVDVLANSKSVISTIDNDVKSTRLDHTLSFMADGTITKIYADAKLSPKSGKYEIKGKSVYITFDNYTEESQIVSFAEKNMNLFAYKTKYYQDEIRNIYKELGYTDAKIDELNISISQVIYSNIYTKK